ncbi:AAA family ATPase [Pseudomonas sp. Marseille-Q5115]|uniref:AAA family ATPase n=1 Tax=Pseudomonas sp. Marseille-Q5115 TaxID=2866593 RepID=UPI001CE447C8|nr:MoxR family ATPase [Pseudomonas sp. Marseille-Q5115]
MTDNLSAPSSDTGSPDTVPASGASLAAWANELNTALVGQPAVIEALLIALLAGGHVLLEGPPGCGKRTAARALAASFGAAFSEVPCLPAPAVAALHPQTSNSGEASATGQVLLVHGLEQANLDTQAVLGQALRAAAEDTVELPASQVAPFLLIGCRHPLDSAGVAPLSESLLDRFMLAVPVGFPGVEDETRMVREVSLSPFEDMLAIAAPQRLHTFAQVVRLRASRAEVRVDERLVDYAVRLVRATRYGPRLSTGAGPRAAIALVRCAQARALLQGRDHALPEDIKACAPAVLRHRVRLAVTQRVEGIALEQALAEQLDQVGAPRP